MAGKIIAKGADPHVCEPGVVEHQGQGRGKPKRAIYADVKLGALWQCDDCSAVWQLGEGGWVRA